MYYCVEVPNDLQHLYLKGTVFWNNFSQTNRIKDQYLSRSWGSNLNCLKSQITQHRRTSDYIPKPFDWMKLRAQILLCKILLMYFFWVPIINKYVLK